MTDLTTPAASPTAEPVPVKLRDHVTGALAYITFIPAVILLLVGPYKRNPFVRFHSFQSIFLSASTIVLTLGIRVLYSLFTMIPYAGYLLGWLATGVALLGWIIVWVVVLIKALQGETFHLPVIGRLAERC